MGQYLFVLCSVVILFSLYGIVHSNSDEDRVVELGVVSSESAPPPVIHSGRRRHHRSRHGDDRPVLRVKNDFPVQQRGSLRIRGGNVSDTQNFPYMAAIIINSKLWCAGAIVDVNWVLTAAHCLNYVLHVSPAQTISKFVKVRVGSANAHDGGRLLSVTGAIRHPKFEEEPVPHADIALLKLAENLEISARVNLIKIYDSTIEPYAQSFVVVSGWGATKGSETAFRDTPPELMSSRLKVRTHSYCSDAYQLVNGFQFSEDFFCASLRNGTRDACLFDAGAPAIQKNRLMGVMSFGPEQCGHEYQPAVFIKAFYFKDFVANTIKAYKSNAEIIQAMQDMDPGLVLGDQNAVLNGDLSNARRT